MAAGHHRAFAAMHAETLLQLRQVIEERAGHKAGVQDAIRPGPERSLWARPIGDVSVAVDFFIWKPKNSLKFTR